VVAKDRQKCRGV